MNTIVNPLRGQVKLILADVERILRFNNNTWRIMSKNMDIPFSELFAKFGSMDADGMMDFYANLVLAALINEADYNGQSHDYKINTVSAWVGELQPEQLVDLIEAMNNSLGLKKNDEEGNAAAPAGE